MFNSETRYHEAVKGFIDFLKKKGISGPKTIFIIENADGNNAKVVELIERFKIEKMDLIFSVGSTATIPLAREITDTPIVFSVVYDPIEAGIAKDWKSSGNNTTGTSSYIPMEKVLKTITLFPTIKKLAILYTPGEKNSESQLRNLQAAEKTQKIKITPVPMTTKEDIQNMLPDVLKKSDAIFITGSNIITSQILEIIALANKAKVISVTHLEDLIHKGVAFGVTFDPYLLGTMAGEKAYKIFQVSKPSSIPIEYPSKYNFLLNLKTVKAGQFKIPENFLKIVNKKIE